MRRNRINKVIEHVYGDRYRLGPEEIPSRLPQPAASMRSVQEKVKPIVYGLRKQWLQVALIVLIVLLVAPAVYYYNTLVTSEQDMFAARGNVHTLLQRRNDISVNLSKAVFDYSRHERMIFPAVVALRSFLSKENVEDTELGQLMEELERQGLAPTVKEPSAKSSTVGPTGLPPSLGSLMAVAEQYPDLKLSTTFQSLMTALIEVEKDLGSSRIKYNDMVNVYTTYLMQFPINVYARLFGFEVPEYFTATDDAKGFRPIEY